jgi:signal transduction histidine kinase
MLAVSAAVATAAAQPMEHELNAQLNDELELRSNAARSRAEDLRRQARRATVACFALAIVLATGLGLWLTRTVVRRVDGLRQGARRIGSGDLGARIELAGNDEFAELAASFNQMAASLAHEQAALVRSQKLASIGQVAAGVAHELNNPLSVILGYAKLLRANPGPRPTTSRSSKARLGSVSACIVIRPDEIGSQHGSLGAVVGRVVPPIGGMQATRAAGPGPRARPAASAHLVPVRT